MIIQNVGLHQTMQNNWGLRKKVRKIVPQIYEYRRCFFYRHIFAHSQNNSAQKRNSISKGAIFRGSRQLLVGSMHMVGYSCHQELEYKSKASLDDTSFGSSKRLIGMKHLATKSQVQMQIDRQHNFFGGE